MVNSLTFGTFTDRLPPHNLEVEEIVLGSVLIDPQAIFKIKDTLPIEVFYLEVHQDIYRAALNLCRKGVTISLVVMTRHLDERNILRRIGGRSKLAHLVESAVTSVTIEDYCKLLLADYLKRKIINLGNDLLERGHDPHLEVEDLLRLTEEKVTSVIKLDYGLSGGDRDEKEYRSLMDAIKNIERTVLNPGLKLFKLQKLAKVCGKKIQDLEYLYIKSLCESVSGPLKGLAQLNDECKSDTREWLVHGIIPANTTFLIHALGGVGKTKLLYDLAYCLVEGKDWNSFAVTAKSRKVLIYQDDESPHDMRQALRRRGFFEPGFNSDNFRYRRGWTMDNVPQLVKDIDDFAPDLIIIDSITTANRNSIFSENDTAYARPLLEITQIAAERGVSIGLIHHSNGEGGSRGTKAIFNSVSEVLCLKRNPAPEAHEQDKILEIQKSRSRRFPCAYSLFFNEEDFTLSCMGEVNEKDTSDEPQRKRILSFLQNNRGTRFEVDEIVHTIGGLTPSVRRCLSRLSADGFINHLESITELGRKNLYFVDFEKPTHQRNCGSTLIDPDRPPQNVDVEPVSGGSIQKVEKNHNVEKSNLTDFPEATSDTPLEPLQDKALEKTQGGSIRVDQGRSISPILRQNEGREGCEPLPPSDESPKKEYKPICIKVPSPQGWVKANATCSNKTWNLKISFPDGYEINETSQGTSKMIKQRIQELNNEWNRRFSYTIQVLISPGCYESIQGCKLVKMNIAPNGKGESYLFETPNNKAEWIYSQSDFTLET